MHIYSCHINVCNIERTFHVRELVKTSKDDGVVQSPSPHLITLVDYKDVLQSILFTQIKVPVICDAHCMRIYLLFSIIKVLITQTRIPLCLFLTQAWGSYDN